MPTNPASSAQLERVVRPRALLLAHTDGRETLHPFSEYAVAYRDTAVSETMLYALADVPDPVARNLAAGVADRWRDECTRLRGQRLVLLELLADAAHVIHNLPDEVETQDEADMLNTLKNRIADARGAVLLELGA